MIPDKIYVGVGTLSSIQPAEEYAFPGWQEKAYSQIRNEQYIRKEALLEWASQRREAVAKEVVIQEGVRLGADAAFEELIDKLNKM